MGISAVGTNANTRLVSWRALGRSNTLERCYFTRVGTLAVAIQPYFWCSDSLAAFRGNYMVVVVFGNTMFGFSTVVASGADGVIRS